MNTFKKIATVLTVALVPGAFAAPDSNFHIYIAYGQSNMEGNATNLRMWIKRNILA